MELKQELHMYLPPKKKIRAMKKNKKENELLMHFGSFNSVVLESTETLRSFLLWAWGSTKDDESSCQSDCSESSDEEDSDLEQASMSAREEVSSLCTWSSCELRTPATKQQWM